MNLHFTVLAIAGFAVTLLCECKDTDQVQNDIRARKDRAWSAFGTGTFWMTLMSGRKVPFTISIKPTNEGLSSCNKLKKKYVGLSSGVYTIQPKKKSYRAYCDMETEGGGWTIFQRRFDGSVTFYRTWKDYKNGFGEPDGEYWLGNDALHELTRKDKCSLRVELTSVLNKKAHAEYGSFAVGSESTGYKLSVDKYSGTAGDSMGPHSGCMFTTKDRDNDIQPEENCAFSAKGAWWYIKCHYSSLNSLYPYGGKSTNYEGINWYHFDKSYSTNFKETKMMVRCA